MGWFNWGTKVAEDHEEKLNPSQYLNDHKTNSTREATYKYERAYEELEIVNRGVNMIVDDVSGIDVKVGDSIASNHNGIKGIKASKVSFLLNVEPNPFQDISTFRRNLYTDYLLDGNIFIYYDGAHLYHIPAQHMTIHSDSSTYIKKYSFKQTQDYSPKEIIHIKDNSFYSMYRGVSRLKPALRTMILMKRMRDFQDNFFKNGAVPGLVLKTPNTLSEKIKNRMIEAWAMRYSPSNGGRRPLILDGGLEVDAISDVNFKDLDFQDAIAANEKIILKALGIPPILLDSGNNANLRPNMRLYYLETILPINEKVDHALTRFFGFKILPDITDIPALQPELSDQSNYYSSLVNTGIITPNESREKLGFTKSTEKHADLLRIPANIAGSAANPSEGGAPAKDKED